MQVGKRRRIVAEINVTPLTDVFLVLLIIFMVATSAVVQSAEQVHLPKAKADEDPAAAVTVSLDSSRTLRTALSTWRQSSAPPRAKATALVSTIRLPEKKRR